MVIVLLFRSAKKSHSCHDLLKCRYVLFCFQIIVSHVSAACLEYTGRKQLSCKNCLERRCRNFKHTAELSLYSSASKTDIEEKDPRGTG